MVFFGEVVKVRGNKGEVVVKTPPDVEELPFESGEEVTLKSQKYLSKMCVEYCREIDGNVLLKLKNIDSISDAYRLVGYSIFKEGEPERRESNSLLDFSVEDIHGRRWGKVEAFNPDSKNPLLEIDSDGDTIYIPFSENIVINIDKKNRIITIDPPDGLMDLNR